MKNIDKKAAVLSVFDFEGNKQWGVENPIRVKDMDENALKAALKTVRRSYTGRARTYWEFPLMLFLKVKSQKERLESEDTELVNQTIAQLEEA